MTQTGRQLVVEDLAEGIRHELQVQLTATKATSATQYAMVAWADIKGELLAELLRGLDRPQKKTELQVHRLVAVLVLGADLRRASNRGEQVDVHHLNLDGLDNRAENLVPTTKSQHDRIHTALAAFLAGTGTKEALLETLLGLPLRARPEEVVELMVGGGQRTPSRIGKEGISLREHPDGEDGRETPHPRQQRANGESATESPGGTAAPGPAHLPQADALASAVERNRAFGVFVPRPQWVSVEAVVRVLAEEFGPDGATAGQLEAALRARGWAQRKAQTMGPEAAACSSGKVVKVREGKAVRYRLGAQEV